MRLHNAYRQRQYVHHLKQWPNLLTICTSLDSNSNLDAEDKGMFHLIIHYKFYFKQNHPEQTFLVVRDQPLKTKNQKGNRITRQTFVIYICSWSNNEVYTKVMYLFFTFTNNLSFSVYTNLNQGLSQWTLKKNDMIKQCIFLNACLTTMLIHFEIKICTQFSVHIY